MKRTGVIGTLLAALLCASPVWADSSCNRGPKRSPKTTEAIELTIINTGEAPLHLDWLDFKGGPKSYATIQPGKSHVQPTFVGHVWTLTTEVGNCVKKFAAKRGVSVVRVALTNEDELGGD